MKDNLKEQLKMVNHQIKELSGVYRNILSRFGISENEFWIWYTLLIMDGEYSQQDISNEWLLPTQTVNTIIMKMVKKGYVELEVIPRTRNKKIIHITEKGRQYSEKIIMPIAEAELKALEKIQMKEILICTEVFSKYIHFLKGEFDDIS